MFILKKAKPDRKPTPTECLRQIRYIVTFLCFILLPVYTYAQQSKIEDSSLSGQRDISDVLKNIFNINIIAADTVTKKKGTLYMTVLPGIGYSLNTHTEITIGGHAGFYTDNVDSVNLSTFNFNPTFTTKHQILLPFQSNIWTHGNEYNILGNWIYYKYPELTYGLGGHTLVKDAEKLNYRYVLFHEAILKKVFTDMYAGIGFDLDYHWKITDGGLTGGGISDFQRYGETSKSISSGYTIDLLYDNRHNSIKPTNGYYANIVYRNNATCFGSDANWQSMILDLRSYYKLTADSKKVLAFWSYDWFILQGSPPYLDLPASTWDTYGCQGRGYIQSRFRGRNLVSFESEYRGEITHDGFIEGVVFTNVQSVSDWPGNKFEVFYPGFGCGIRIKLNKHDDTMVAVDYGFGLHGSHGLFVNLGEVF